MRHEGTHVLRPWPAHAPVHSPKAALLIAACAPAAALHRSLPRSFKLLHPISSLTTPPSQLLRPEPQRVRCLGGVDSGWRAGLCAGGHVQWSAHLRHAGHAAAAGEHGAGSAGWLAGICCQTMSRLLIDAWAAAQTHQPAPWGPHRHVDHTAMFPLLSKLLLLPTRRSGASRRRLQQRPAGAARRPAPARQQSKLADHLHTFLAVTYLRPVTAPTRFEGSGVAAGRPVLAAKVTGAAAGPSAAGLPLGPAQPNWRRIPKERKGGRRLQGRSSLGGAAAPSPAAHGRDLKKSTGSDAATDWVQLRGVPCGLPLLAPCLRQKQQEGCSNPAIGVWAVEGAGLLAGSGSNSLQYGKNTARPGQGRQVCKATQANSKVGTIVKPQAAGDKMGMEWGAAAAAAALLQGQAGRGGRGTPPGRRLP